MNMQVQVRITTRAGYRFLLKRGGVSTCKGSLQQLNLTSRKDILCSGENVRPQKASTFVGSLFNSNIAVAGSI